MESSLKVTVSSPEDKEIGFFYIPSDAPLQYLKRNLAYLIRGAQIIGGFKPEDLQELPTPEEIKQ